MNTFPVLMNQIEWSRFPDCPRSVPWDLLASHEAQAFSNHSQDLATLARRGGLDPIEMVAVLTNHRYSLSRPHKEEMAFCVNYLKGLVADVPA